MSCHEDSRNCVIKQDILQRSCAFDSLILLRNQFGFLLRGTTNVFQWQLKMLYDGQQVVCTMIAKTNKSILLCVGVAQFSHAAHALVSVYDVI